MSPIRFHRFSIGSGNGLSPVRHQAITCTNAALLSIGPLGTGFSEIGIKNEKCPFIKMHLKMSCTIWRPFCSGRAELMMESGILNNVLSFPVLSVGCYTCSSFNNSDPGCSDPFNPAFSTYVHSCKQGKKDRVGLFPATFCIKMDGISCKLIMDCLPGHGLHMMTPHGDVIKWKHFPRHWPFVREIHRSPVNFPHKGPWRWAFMISLICALNRRLLTIVRLVIWDVIALIMI